MHPKALCSLEEPRLERGRSEFFQKKQNKYKCKFSKLLPVCLQCSVSCGGGQQQREITCVRAEDRALMPNNVCETKSKPDTLRKCNLHDCVNNTGTVCTVQAACFIASEMLTL